MIKKGPITGTYIDEVSVDIPSSNWSREQWIKDLDYMQEIGIDTVIFIRGGYKDKSVFPSKVLGTSYADDLAGLIFEETSKRNMSVFFGLYMSNDDWNRGDYMTEIKINREFVNEVCERYGMPLKATMFRRTPKELEEIFNSSTKDFLYLLNSIIYQKLDEI